MMAKAEAMQVRIEGVTLEPMLAGGVEILAGCTRDPVFGWLLTVGLGGVWTELMHDAVHALLPVEADEAEAMLRNLKGFKLLDGYRGAPKADVAAAAQAMTRIPPNRSYSDHSGASRADRAIAPSSSPLPATR